MRLDQRLGVVGWLLWVSELLAVGGTRLAVVPYASLLLFVTPVALTLGSLVLAASLIAP